MRDLLPLPRGPIGELKRRVRRHRRRRATGLALVGGAMLARRIARRARA